jgi:hypothetical protein
VASSYLRVVREDETAPGCANLIDALEGVLLDAATRITLLVSEHATEAEAEDVLTAAKGVARAMLEVTVELDRLRDRS